MIWLRPKVATVNRDIPVDNLTEFDKITSPGDSVAGPNDVVEGDRRFVGKNQINLWMRNAKTFDQILHRRGRVDVAPPRDLSTVRGQEVVERPVHSDDHVDHAR